MTWLQLNMYTSQMTMEEIDIAEVELANLYFDFGISADNSSIYDKDGALKPMPIIGDIYDRFAERPELARVNKAIKKYVTGQCQNMNGPTNVDLTNKFICFDVDEANMNKELLAPFILAAIDCAYSLIRQSRVYLDTIFLDETWRLLAHHGAAELIKDMVKIIRGYGGAVVTITQDINDYISNPAGKAIVANTAIKMVMHLERPECRALAENLGLSEEDIRVITRLKRGQAMIITALNKIVVNIRPSEKEEREFTTDPNKLKTIAEEKATNGEGR
jgi:type IV secretory pathway VirB4 component